MKRRGVSRSTRNRIIERDKVCQGPGCGDTGGPWEIDHEIGVFFNDIDPERWTMEILEADKNLRLLCKKCHLSHSRLQTKIRAKLNRLTRPEKKKKKKIPSRPFPKRSKKLGQNTDRS